MQNSKQQRHQNKIRAIYEIVIKLGFPFNLQDDLSSQEENPSSLSVKLVMIKIGKYIQATQSRLQLMQWLINKWKHNKLNSRLSKSVRIQNLVDSLGMIGLLPVSKHTKNMDYTKFVQGLLGFESSVNLIYKLCLFIKKTLQVRKRDRIDTKIVSLTKQLCENKDQLVHTSYDPFGITFPQAFKHLSTTQFDKKYSQFLTKIQNKSQSINRQIIVDDSFMNISKQTKQRFRTTMLQFINISSNIKQSDIPQFQQPERSRLVEVDGQFVNIYKKFIQSITFSEEKSQGFRTLHQNVKQMIDDL